MNIECINCGMDNAYCDGVNYVCPDCGYEWDCPEIPSDDDDELECPNCGLLEYIYKDTTGQADYICDNCGHRWNEDDDNKD
jgi:uncharacterized Zn ribbon protein